MKEYKYQIPLLFKEDLLPRGKYGSHESTRKTLQRPKTPVKLLVQPLEDSGKGGSLSSITYSQQSLCQLLPTPPSVDQHQHQAWIFLNRGPPGRFSAAKSKPQCFEKSYVSFQRYDGCYAKKDGQVMEQREFCCHWLGKVIIFFCFPFPLCFFSGL